jgi:hypothetical protein
VTVLETYVARPVSAMTLVDHFAEVRRTRGRVPPPIPPLHFKFVARREGGVMTPLEPPILLKAKSGPSGAFLFADEQRVGGAVYRITPGLYLMRIESDYYQPVAFETEWPLPQHPPRTVPLLPGPAYPFPDVTLSSTRLTLLRGAIVAGVLGAPIAGVLVEMVAPPFTPPDTGELARCVTDASGGWVLTLLDPVLPADFMATLRFTKPDGGAVIDVPDVRVLRGADNTLSNTALRGIVLAAAGATPIHQAEITIDGRAGSVFTDRDGRWIFYLALSEPDGVVRVNATSPSGSTVAQDTPIRNRATVVVPPFRVG